MADVLISASALTMARSARVQWAINSSRTDAPVKVYFELCRYGHESASTFRRSYKSQAIVFVPMQSSL